MKKILIFSLIVMAGQLGLAQEPDILTANQETFKIYYRFNRTYYIVRNKKKVYNNLKFAKVVWPNIQVIDAKNHSFYLNEKLKRTKGGPLQMGFCGTVPNYTMTIQSLGDHYIVTKDETFFDQGNKIPPDTILTIAKNQVDSLYFVNQAHRFSFTENYGLSQPASPNPNLLLFKKGSKYGYYSINKEGKWQKSPLYDKITIEDGLLKCFKDGLVGYQGINDAPKYKSISKFDNYLARFELPNGQKGYLDADGKEYWD